MAGGQMHDQGRHNYRHHGRVMSVYTTSASAGAAADAAADVKEIKYQTIALTHTFILLTFEMLGPINYNASQLALATCVKPRFYPMLQLFNFVCFNGSLINFHNADQHS